MCLLKYDRFGNQLWSRTWGGSESDRARRIAVDSADNIYLAGGTSSFGAVNGDACLVKYDSSGNQKWYSIWGGSDHDFAEAIAVDSLDNVYVGGTKWAFHPPHTHIL